jgi:hypothetical protein
MPAIVSDHDVRGHFQILLRTCHSEQWLDVWNQLGIGVETFENLGIASNSSDRDVWLSCQRHQAILITGNRNAESANSLEAVIAELGESTSLPVFTIAQPLKIYTSRDYAELAAVRMMEYLIDVDALRGSGRLYLP